MTQAATPTDPIADSSAQSMTSQDQRRAVVGCQQLTKVFKDFWMRDRARAVDKLDLVINEHEVFGLLGPNGSGKSTIIKLILGLLKPTSGRVVVFGKSPTDVAMKKRIGYLPEESYLYPFLNARETLDYYGKLFGLDSKTRHKRIDELLEMVGLEHAQFRPVREYSKGMQRRIGIAQALINDPDLLILDEPTTGLDPIGTRQVKDLILELGRRGKTIILSSHLLTDVEDVVDRMAILYGGKIRGEGTCDELLTSSERTQIDTDELDEQTIAEIDELIRKRSGGQKSIRTVSAPRQKLEELFLGIVERAQTERTSTSGAMHGGSTASFLQADEQEIQQGEALIESLLNDSAAPVAPVIESSSDLQSDSDNESGGGVGHDQPPQQDDALIGSLLNDEPSATDTRETQSQASHVEPTEDVDLGMIGSLLNEDEQPGTEIIDDSDRDGDEDSDEKRINK
jgi:ABC-2 type transport system ATP-binding protein